jgi:hypothetical protein
MIHQESTLSREHARDLYKRLLVGVTLAEWMEGIAGSSKSIYGTSSGPKLKRMGA